jgi:hypothetical protein
MKEACENEGCSLTFLKVVYNNIHTSAMGQRVSGINANVRTIRGHCWTTSLYRT